MLFHFRVFFFFFFLNLYIDFQNEAQNVLLPFVCGYRYLAVVYSCLLTPWRGVAPTLRSSVSGPSVLAYSCGMSVDIDSHADPAHAMLNCFEATGLLDSLQVLWRHRKPNTAAVWGLPGCVTHIKASGE